jgi:hypothetical protein
VIVKSIGFSLLFICQLICGDAQVAVSFNVASSGFSAPVDIASPADGSDRLFIVEQQGLIKIWNGSILSKPFLDIFHPGNIQRRTGSAESRLPSGLSGQRFFLRVLCKQVGKHRDSPV